MNNPDVTLYVAFSIHGTKTFITASRTVPKTSLNGTLQVLKNMGMEPIGSRRPGFNPNKELKLQWDKLLTKKDKRPMRDPARITHLMRKLTGYGFTVNDKNFIDYHFRNERKDHSVPR